MAWTAPTYSAQSVLASLLFRRFSRFPIVCFQKSRVPINFPLAIVPPNIYSFLLLVLFWSSLPCSFCFIDLASLESLPPISLSLRRGVLRHLWASSLSDLTLSAFVFLEGMSSGDGSLLSSFSPAAVCPLFGVPDISL